MSDKLPDVAALTTEARTLAKAYVGVGHRRGVENLLTRLSDSLESLSARVTQAEDRGKAIGWAERQKHQDEFPDTVYVRGPYADHLPPGNGNDQATKQTIEGGSRW